MDISDSEVVWIQFLESPIAELEGFGIETKFITQLETRFGLYIKNLQVLTPQQTVDVTRNFGRVSVVKLSNALRAYLEFLQDEQLRKTEGTSC